MRVESRQFGREDRDSTGRVLVRHKDRPAAIFPSKATIATHETFARLTISLLPLVPLVASISARNDGQREREGRDEARCARAERSLARESVQPSEQASVEVVKGLCKAVHR